MKEIRFFYNPEPETCELPSEEAEHALRVLRLQMGDEIWLMDGKGTFYRATITEATKKRCLYRIEESLVQNREWKGHLHLAVAPTKNIDRMEWLAEKATEIGFDELTFLECQNSERKIVKEERIEKILVSAMKQSHKSELPRFNGMVKFADFVKTISNETESNRYICHCYEGEKPMLKNVLKEGDAVVMIGPEGDFSLEEVEMAEKKGFRPVTLGKSRLRTETAALVAVNIMHIWNE